LNTVVNAQDGKDAVKPSRLDLWRAERKLAMARAALEANRTAWAWFAAHEAAELAARAIHRNGNGRERMVARLLLHAADHVSVPEDLIRKAALLDNHYIPHQNGHSLTPPDRTAVQRQAEVMLGDPTAPGSEIAVETAEEIVAFARGVVKR